MKKIGWSFLIVGILLFLFLIGHELRAQKISREHRIARNLIKESRQELREVQDWLKGVNGNEKLQKEVDHLLKEAEKLLSDEKKLGKEGFLKEAKEIRQEVKKLYERAKKLVQPSRTREALIFEQPTQEPEKPPRRTLPKEERRYAYQAEPEIERLPFPSEGIIEYSTPEKMNVGETKKVEVRVSQEKLKTLFEESELDMRRTREEIAIYQLMNVTLEVNPDEFRIISSPKDAKERIKEKGYAAWVWYIKALEEGKNEIYFRVNGQVDHKEYVEVERKIIHVEVGPALPLSETLKSFWTEHWKWILSSIGALIVIIFTSYIQKKFKKKG